MRVVVTRPETSAARTAERLRAMGHEPVLLPLARAVHDHVTVGEALNSTPPALVVTSAEAIRAFSASEPVLEPLLTVPFFAVGPATAAEARQAGFINVLESQGSGAELADLIADKRPVVSAANPLLYLAGSPRAAGFEARLDERQIPYRVIEVYRMETVDHSPATVRRALFDPPADVVLLYSRANALRFLGLPLSESDRKRLQTLRFACLSRNVAEALPDNLRQQASVAASPDEDTLFCLLGQQM